MLIFILQFLLKIEKPASAAAPAGFWNPEGLLLLTWDAEVRRHARHVMMVVMTMMGANLHLIFTLGEDGRDVNCGTKSLDEIAIGMGRPTLAKGFRMQVLQIEHPKAC